METIDVTLDSDEREEGEIVDDDFEDISDSSLTLPIENGKLTTSKRHLRGLSLSSISDGEPEIRVVKRRRKSESKKRPSRRKKNRKHATISDSDSDGCLFNHSMLKKQLKAAVCIEKEEWHVNSLKTRLKIMQDLGSNKSEPDNQGEDKVEDNQEKIDNELMLLRSEALRTAIFNKYTHKKKRKLKDEGNMSDNSVASETNKENNDKNLNLEVEDNNTQEDDEDILRANLLASMSQKIAKPVEITEKIEDKTKNVPKPVKAISNYKVVRKITNKPVLAMPVVKPLIISINNDSDTEEEMTTKTNGEKPELPSNIPHINDIQSTVDKFLKEQRAQVEAKTAKVSTPVLKNKPNNVPFKSAVKLLPKDKQIEYQKLVQKLALANKNKPAVKKKLIEKTPNKSIKNDLAASKILPNKGNEGKILPKVTVNRVKVSAANTPKSEKVLDFRREFYTFRGVHKELYVQKNGRLQIQESYAQLKPLVGNICTSISEQKKQDKRVKELVLELNAARKKLDQTQQIFCVKVQELLAKKRQIDSSEIKKLPPNPTNLLPPRPKTPLAVEIPQPSPTVKTPELKTVSLGEETINFGDPNDILKILEIKKMPIVETTLSKYISPLDSKRVETFDPLAIICPYEVDGNCRDKDCQFKHIL